MAGHQDHILAALIHTQKSLPYHQEMVTNYMREARHRYINNSIIQYHSIRNLASSVSDPNTLNLGSRILPNLDPYPELCFFYVKNSFGGKKFPLKISVKKIFKKYKKNNGNGRNFKTFGSLNGEFLSTIYHLLPQIYSIFPVWIRIHIGNTDPRSCGKWIQFGSGSTSLLALLT